MKLIKRLYFKLEELDEKLSAKIDLMLQKFGKWIIDLENSRTEK